MHRRCRFKRLLEITYIFWEENSNKLKAFQAVYIGVLRLRHYTISFIFSCDIEGSTLVLWINTSSQSNNINPIPQFIYMPIYSLSPPNHPANIRDNLHHPINLELACFWDASGKWEHKGATHISTARLCKLHVKCTWVQNQIQATGSTIRQRPLLHHRGAQILYILVKQDIGEENGWFTCDCLFEHGTAFVIT